MNPISTGDSGDLAGEVGTALLMQGSFNSRFSVSGKESGEIGGYRAPLRTWA